VELRLTRRARQDLGIDDSAPVGLDARELVGAHPLVTAFAERRGRHPEGQEAIQLRVSRAIVHSLHAGRWRGLTWWERDEDTVWLLGAGYHRSGERGDVYAVLKQRDLSDVLFPTEQDYLDHEPDPSHFAERLAEDAPRLRSAGLLRPGTEVIDEIGGALEIGLFVLVLEENGVRLQETWLSFRMPPKAEVPPYPEWLNAAIAALLPEAEVTDLEFGLPFPRPTGPISGEIVVRIAR
jgi:hypothetical protein